MLQIFDLILQAGIFALVVCLILLLQRIIEFRLAVGRRLGAEASAPKAAAGVVKADTVANGFLAWVQSATSLKDPTETGRLRRDLARAGFEGPSAPVWYVIVRFSLAIGLPVALIAAMALTGHPLTGLGAVVFPLVLCGMGLIAPRAFVDNRATAMREAVENEFPDALDLMVVCVESGLGLEAAFVQVASQITESHPNICTHLRRMAEEISVGRSRADALRALAERVDVETVRAFVALLVQTDSLGVSIAQSLRTYSAEMRETRYLKAEEKAMRIPVLMTLPIVACFMPVVVVALLLPPIIDAVRLLGPALRTP